MPHVESNIPQNIFYSTIKGEFLTIAIATLCLKPFLPTLLCLIVGGGQIANFGKKTLKFI